MDRKGGSPPLTDAMIANAVERWTTRLQDNLRVEEAIRSVAVVTATARTAGESRRHTAIHGPDAG
jgi:hypothetical protein